VFEKSEKIEINFLQYYISNQTNMSIFAIKVNKAERVKVLKFVQEKQKKPIPFDTYLTDDYKISCFYTDETHHQEKIIFNYYDENKYTLKYKTDRYFLLVSKK
jgi:hypothetical protein